LDEVIAGRTFLERFDKLRKMRQPQIKPGKCKLFHEVRYLGHVSPKGVTTDPEKLGWPPPKEKPGLISFLRLWINRRFRAGFAKIAESLTQLRRKADFPVVTRNRHRFPVPERVAVYGTSPRKSAAA
jgi:hypothetical protein